MGKLTPDIIDEELQTNIIIEQEVQPHFHQKAKIKKGDFNVKLVDSLNTSALLLAGFPAELFEPALKFVKYHDIRICDFSDMNLQDTNM